MVWLGGLGPGGWDFWDPNPPGWPTPPPGFFPFKVTSQNLDGMHWRYIFQWLNTEKCEGELGKSKWSC